MIEELLNMHACPRETRWSPGKKRESHVLTQGYLAHKKAPPPLFIRAEKMVGPAEVALHYEYRGTSLIRNCHH
jgi:hypothetical protein